MHTYICRDWAQLSRECRVHVLRSAISLAGDEASGNNRVWAGEHRLYLSIYVYMSLHLIPPPPPPPPNPPSIGCPQFDDDDEDDDDEEEEDDDGGREEECGTGTGDVPSIAPTR